MKNKIIYLLIMTGLFLSCSEKKTEISSNDFQRLLSSDSIQRMSVFNDESVTIEKKSSDFDGEIYELKIHSSDQFKRKLDAFAREYIDKHEAQPTYNISYVRGSTNFLMNEIKAVTLTLCWIFLFLFAAIDILKNRFVSDIDKLIWILVVIFVPFAGPILYLFIGRKQRLLNDK